MENTTAYQRQPLAYNPAVIPNDEQPGMMQIEGHPTNEYPTFVPEERPLPRPVTTAPRPQPPRSLKHRVRDSILCLGRASDRASSAFAAVAPNLKWMALAALTITAGVASTAGLVMFCGIAANDSYKGGYMDFSGVATILFGGPILIATGIGYAATIALGYATEHAYATAKPITGRIWNWLNT